MHRPFYTNDFTITTLSATLPDAGRYMVIGLVGPVSVQYHLAKGQSFFCILSQCVNKYICSSRTIPEMRVALNSSKSDWDMIPYLIFSQQQVRLITIAYLKFS